MGWTRASVRRAREGDGGWSLPRDEEDECDGEGGWDGGLLVVKLDSQRRTGPSDVVARELAVTRVGFMSSTRSSSLVDTDRRVVMVKSKTYL